MKTMKCAAILASVLAFLTPATAWSAVTFNVSSLSTSIRAQGRTELVGAVTLTAVSSGTIPSGALSLSYSAPIAPASTPVTARITCNIGGSSVCPAGIGVQVTDSSVILGFTSVTVNVGDTYSFVQTRIDASALPQGTTTITAILTGTGGSGITVNQSLFSVGAIFQPVSASAFIPPAQGGGVFACSSPGLSAVSFGFTVTEGVSNAFTTLAQEIGGGAGVGITNGTTLEVVLTNVPTGVTITPTGFTGSDATIAFLTPAAQTSTGPSNTMTFVFPFTATNNSVVETAAVNFTAGFTAPVDLATVVGPISAAIRLGPVSADPAPPVVSFISVPLVSGTPLVIVPCRLAAPQTNPLLLSAVSGSVGAPQGVSVIEVNAFMPAYTSIVSTTTGGNWLSYSPTTGTIPATLAVTPDATNLAAGTYKGSITVSAIGAVPVTIPVQLLVASSNPAIALNPTSVTFNTFLGQGNPASQNVAITNSGGGVFPWTATVTTQNGGTWLSATPASGNSNNPVAISANVAGLSAGTYTGTVSIASPNIPNSPQNISVTLNITVAPTLTVSPAGTIGLSTTVGSNPTSQLITVTNTGGSGSTALTVVAATQTGGNWLAASPSNGATPLQITVSAAAATLAAGTYQGTITVTAAAGSGTTNSPLVIPVTLGVGVPAITQGGIVGGAAFGAGLAVTPGSIASIFGTRLASQTLSSSGALTTTLGGTQVLVNGVAVPLFYVGPTQINFQMPFEATGSPVSVVVVSGGQQSPPVLVNTIGSQPGIFTVDGSGIGTAAAVNADNSPNSATKPDTAGTIIQLYATGLGNVFPLVADGQPGNSGEPLNRTVVTPTVLINGNSAVIQYSGLAPGFVGLYQLNVFIPAGTPAGPATVQITEPSGTSSNTVTISVK